MFTILRSKSILTYEFASLTCCVDLNIWERWNVVIICECCAFKIPIRIKPTILFIAASGNCLKKQISVIAIEKNRVF